MLKKGIILGFSCFLFNLAFASKITIPIHLFTNKGENQLIGHVILEDSTCGVLIKPQLSHLRPGVHGFHVHVNPSCEDKGLKAGAHLDPQQTDAHKGPYAHGHLGDLPVLIVDSEGKANLPTLAPQFKLSQMRGHALMIHAGGDNYADKPEKLGGGGERIACGVIN